MKKLLLLIAIFSCSIAFAQQEKVKPIEIPAPTHVSLCKALSNEAWITTHSQLMAGALYLHAEKPWGGNSKWEVTMLSAENKLSVWFYFLNNGTIEVIPENKLNDAAKSLIEELRKASK